MNTFKLSIVALGLGVLASSTSAQGTFQNLDFEQANPVIVVGGSYYPYSVTTASALPYWTVTIGGVQQTQITENDPSIGYPWVVLAGPGLGSGIIPPIDGSYSVLLQGSFPASIPSISQTGTIPAGTKSLLFEAHSGSGALDVLLGTQIVPFVAVGIGPNYTLYGANISAWAGQTEQLAFAACESSTGLNNWVIDDISFSTTVVVPEPGPLALTGVGAVLFALCRRFAAKR